MNKILFETKEGTTGFWGLIGCPSTIDRFCDEKHICDNTDGKHCADYSKYCRFKYNEALESCKEKKLEIVNPEVLPGYTGDLGELLTCNNYTDGEIFDLPIGYSLQPEGEFFRLVKVSEWIDIPGFPYQINRSGQVKTLSRVLRGGNNMRTTKEKILKHKINPDGYPYITLHNIDTHLIKSIHRLLAESFIPNPNNLPEVNHIDGNPANFELSNLEWCTHKSNMIHASETGLLKNHCTEIVAVHNDGSVHKFHSMSMAAKNLGINKFSISLATREKRPHKGFMFYYADQVPEGAVPQPEPEESQEELWRQVDKRLTINNGSFISKEDALSILQEQFHIQRKKQ